MSKMNLKRPINIIFTKENVQNEFEKASQRHFRIKNSLIALDKKILLPVT